MIVTAYILPQTTLFNYSLHFMSAHQVLLGHYTDVCSRIHFYNLKCASFLSNKKYVVGRKKIILGESIWYDCQMLSHCKNNTLEIM